MNLSNDVEIKLLGSNTQVFIYTEYVFLFNTVVGYVDFLNVLLLALFLMCVLIVSIASKYEK